MLKYANFYEINDVLGPQYAAVKNRENTVEEFLPIAENYINENLRVE